MAAFQGGVIALYDPITGLGFPLPLQGAVARTGRGRPAPETTIAPTLIPGPTTVVVPARDQACRRWPRRPLGCRDLDARARCDGHGARPVIRWLLPLAGFQRHAAQVRRMPANGAPPGQYTGSLDDVGEYAIAPNHGTVAYVVTGELWI